MNRNDILEELFKRFPEIITFMCSDAKALGIMERLVAKGLDGTLTSANCIDILKKELHNHPNPDLIIFGLAAFAFQTMATWITISESAKSEEDIVRNLNYAAKSISSTLDEICPE